MPDNFKQLLADVVTKSKAELVATVKPKIEQRRVELDTRATQLIVALRNKLLQANRS